jgi:argininosuccinate lyase
MKLWGGRFAKATDALVEEFTASIAFDRRLYRQDIRAVLPMPECWSGRESLRRKREKK